MTVIVGSGQGGEKKKRLLLILAVVAVLVLAGGAGAALRWWQNRNDKKDTSSQTHGSGLSSTVDDIQSLRAQGNVDGANNRIIEALKDPNTTDKERYELYIQQGNALADKQDLAGALAAYTKAEQIDSTYEITVLLGDTYKQTGDKAKAIEYYKKALPLVPESPMQDENKATLKQNIKDLGGES
jgi:tetratricopeptide (TPR) repeat protein